MNLLLTAILGGVFVSDATAIGHFMISRPIFCGPVIGLILGDITTGIYIGIMMEMIWINVIPLGKVVPPDASVVAVSATYIGAVGGGEKGYLVFLILCLIPVGILFKKLDIIHREFNGFLSYKLDEKIAERDISYIDKIILVGAMLFIVKGVIFLAVIMYLGEIFFPYAYSFLNDSLKKALLNLFYIIPAIGFGTAATIFFFKKSQTAVKK